MENGTREEPYLPPNSSKNTRTKEQSKKLKPPLSQSGSHSFSKVKPNSQAISRDPLGHSKGKGKERLISNRMEPSVDPELLLLCPDLAHDLEAPVASNERSKEKRQVTDRSAKPNSIPTNPLASRQNSQSLIARKRKKQRLTMGVGDDD